MPDQRPWHLGEDRRVLRPLHLAPRRMDFEIVDADAQRLAWLGNDRQEIDLVQAAIRLEVGRFFPRPLQRAGLEDVAQRRKFASHAETEIDYALVGGNAVARLASDRKSPRLNSSH